MLVPDKKLVYSLYLDRVLTTPANLLGGANITAVASRRTAVVEYNGVVVVAPNRQNLIAYEGSVVSDFLHQTSCVSASPCNFENYMRFLPHFMLAEELDSEDTLWHFHCFLLDTPVKFERKGDVVTPWCHLKLTDFTLTSPSLLRFERKLTTSVFIQSSKLDFSRRLPYKFLVSKETVVLCRWEGET